MIVKGMHGLGDNLYQRAVLKHLRGRTIYLETPWPQIYADLENVNPVFSASRLRTQRKNELLSARRYKRIPKGVVVSRWHYRHEPGKSMLQSLAEGLGIKATAFDMTGPDYVGPETDRPYIVVRPVTERTEWKSASRGPLPEYVRDAVEALREHYAIVSVADLEAGKEWALEPLPFADYTFHRGELNVKELLGLVRGAAGLVGGVGWIVPAALAYRRPLFLIYGGWGQANGPERIFGPGVERDFIDEVFPDAFCRCNSNSHNCNKRISNIGTRARAFVDRLTREVGLAA